MTDPSSDRNVLFGVVAWQMGLVDRETLASAMYAWMTDKRRTLPDVLQQSGKLSDDDRRRLQEVVDWQARKHQGDPARTLSVLSSIDSVRSELEQIAHRAIAPTIDDPSGADAKAATVGREGAAGKSHAPSGVDGETNLTASTIRFRVLRAHARGGLGEVFVAMDDELKREVALKQILPKHAANISSRSRFLREAEVTGNLEHPGVVPVYGLGTQADGRPYYAMRFIRGESLEDAIQRLHAEHGPHRSEGQQALEFRNLLARFVAVCNTIEYAHSRGIIHRDLKPENIMLGPYGETLVVDWGLARPVDVPPEDEIALDGEGDDLTEPSETIARPTQIGTVIGTPQFMSPEQAAGRIDLLTPAGDIYSLGATLYCLLTDQPPFISADVRKVLADVQAGRFPSPRQVRRDVPPALEAICLKAMALRPEDRYPSARALADDIEHWMADEPVSALPETAAERLARWMRRHKTWTQAAAAATVIIAVVTAVAYVREAALHNIVQSSLQHEQQARREADAARKLADDNARLAEHEKRLAEAHALRAEQQSALALATLKSVLFDIQAKLKNVPAAQSVRLSMLNTVIDGLKQVARSLETADEADRSLVRAHLDLGDIFLDVGLGENTSATQEARRQFERGAEVATKLRAADPTGAAAKGDLAAAYQRLGDVSLRTGNLAAGADWFRKSLDLREELSAAHPDDLQVRRSLADSVQRMGIVRQQMDQLADAKPFYARFFELTQQLIKAEPNNLEYQRSLSVSYERMGDISLSEHDEKSADDYFQKSLAVRRRLVEASSNAAPAQRDMSVTLDRLGDVALRRGDAEAAARYYEQSLELRKQLSAADPDNVQARRDLLVSYAQLGDVAQRRNDVERADAYYRLYHEMAVKLAAGDPANVQFQRDLATSFERAGYALRQAGKFAESRDAYRKNFDIIKRLADADPADPQFRHDLATSYVMLGDLSRQLGDWRSARDYLTQYGEFARSRAVAAPADRGAKRTLIDALLRSGDVALQLADLSSATAELTEARKLAESLLAESSDDAATRILTANVASMLGQRAIEDRDPRTAAEWIRRGIAEMKPIVAASAGPERDMYADWIAEQEKVSAMCDQAVRAGEDAEFASKQTSGPVAELLDFRAAALERADKFDEAEAVAERIAGREPPTGDALFIAARRFASIASHRASNGDAATKAATERCTVRAVELLKRAADLGYFDDPTAAARLEAATDLRRLSERLDFRELIERVRRKVTAPVDRSGKAAVGEP